MDRDPFSYSGTELTALAGAHHYYEWILRQLQAVSRKANSRGRVGGRDVCRTAVERAHADYLILVEPAVRRGSTGDSREYPRFGELASLASFEYHEAAYADYPAFYSGLDVFVSPAQMEGGPIPLLEAMMSNTAPVASLTGFAPDIIRDGEHGFLFDVDAPSEQIAELIDKAFNSKSDVRTTVVHLTWERFVGDVARYFP
jgi:glycosyltransferase involved in cell wall biosynthesis